jgi:phytoene synthase
MAAAPALSPVAEIARRHDPDRFLCALFAPAAQREALFALIAFNHELARAREAASQPLAALIRLQWWRDAVAEAAAGRPPRRHETAEPLAAAIAGGALDPADLQAMVDAREAETEPAIPSLAAFLAHARGTAGGVALATARLLGAPEAALPAVQALGTAYGIAGTLRAVPILARQGRTLLPEDLLADQGIGVEAAAQDPSLPGVRAVARRLAAEAETLLATRLRLPRGSIAAILPATLARRDLARLRRRGFDLATPPAPRGFGDRLAVTFQGMAAPRRGAAPPHLPARP